MPFLKPVYEKYPLSAEISLHDFFERVEDEHAFLFESGKAGRYSYIVYDPFLVAWSQGRTAQMIQRKDFMHMKKTASGRIVELTSDQALVELLGEFRYKGEAPVPFFGGAAGFLSYDYGCRFVGVEQKVYDDLGLPDYAFNFYDKVIAFDHEEKVFYLIGTAETDIGAKRKIEEIKKDLGKSKRLKRAGRVGEVSSNVSEREYIEKVNQIKELLRKGESYQVNYSQRFRAECTVDGWSVYKKLAAVNPSPFACYLRFSDYSIVSASPELLLRKRDNLLETHPIKGTVKRGKNEEEDNKLADELLNSKKDEAELSMIVDLERNDLGRVCEMGSVKVDKHREISKYSHVIHTVSRVSGILDRKKNIIDALEAVFPSGSITGCPKKRTMEIIDRFEDFSRGVYTGAAGFISFGGDSDFNILIRTLLLKDGEAYFNAGGGIVIDSDAKKEYDESLMKAQAIIDTLKK